MTRCLRRLVIAAAVLLSFAAVQEQRPAYRLQDHYEKREVMIPMCDGVRLFTILHVPRDTSR